MPVPDCARRGEIATAKTMGRNWARDQVGAIDTTFAIRLACNLDCRHCAMSLPRSHRQRFRGSACTPARGVCAQKPAFWPEMLARGVRILLAVEDEDRILDREMAVDLGRLTLRISARI